MSGALGTSILFDVYALNQAVARLLAGAMRDGPLTPAEYAVYSAIFELESATPTELAARLGMRLTTFMDHLRLIEGRGHARRLPHPTRRALVPGDADERGPRGAPRREPPVRVGLSRVRRRAAGWRGRGAARRSRRSGVPPTRRERGANRAVAGAR